MFKVQDIYVSDQNTYELPLYARKDVWLVKPRVHGFTGNRLRRPVRGTSASGTSADLTVCGKPQPSSRQLRGRRAQGARRPLTNERVS